ncbi:MAG: glycerophosphodiester phosphodiesterase [Epsilonproteobacteria bacterium]|nr:glycerophosphodiester phosphodiesterase [Campylobacterota bacterium]
MEAKRKKPLIVAHRGTHLKGIVENTLEAFKAAFTYNVDAIEGDFHLTKDNVIVCHHDYNIGHLEIRDNTLDTLQTLQPNLPTLTEVLALVPPDKTIYIEIKCGIEIFEFLAPVLQDSQLLHSQIVIISFNAEVIHQAKVTYPSIKAYWLYELKEGMPLLHEITKILDISQADGLSTNITAYTDTFAKSLINAGYSYHVWTYKTYPIDSMKKIERLEKWGVASIALDAIEILKKG